MRLRHVVLLLAVTLSLSAHAQPCRDRPVWTRIEYVEMGDNTSVEMVLTCDYAVYERWYVGFFTGHDQPDLWEWYHIQNAASLLIGK